MSKVPLELAQDFLKLIEAAQRSKDYADARRLAERINMEYPNDPVFAEYRRHLKFLASVDKVVKHTNDDEEEQEDSGSEDYDGESSGSDSETDADGSSEDEDESDSD